MIIARGENHTQEHKQTKG